MSPDTLETRFAALRQQVQDLLERFSGQIHELDSDIRALSPLVREVDRMQAEQVRFREMQGEIRRELQALHRRLDDEQVERQKRLHERQKQEVEDRRGLEKERRQRKYLVFGLAISALSTTIAAIGVLVAVL